MKDQGGRTKEERTWRRGQEGGANEEGPGRRGHGEGTVDEGPRSWRRQNRWKRGNRS